MKIVTDIEQLKKPCVENSSTEYNEEVAAKLLREIIKQPNCIGLACNQIGINDARVCVVHVKDPLYFINPKIDDSDDEIIYTESCLSFPGKSVRVKRYKQITVRADNMEDEAWVFAPTNDNDKLGLLESIAIQHEIAHLNGETMFDYEAEKQKPVRVEKNFASNEFISITDGKTIKEMKWKKAKRLVESGEWKVDGGLKI